ncbi:nnf1 domain-containing protein [Hirsutella rhossiliensis]|uniref:Nnf1 domain-containing protein n=1 Tax=Hirsutella rhossiliensis TaxID=111463 RepID=A0A9P8SKG9_9HYPO|nr:nnf1 domain-containing protein [Hirsutella rhossiliensis]KAH0965896.1 nnf1 domain-containing protein [Hirsutella rhossiliensis]
MADSSGRASSPSVVAGDGAPVQRGEARSRGDAAHEGVAGGASESQEQQQQDPALEPPQPRPEQQQQQEEAEDGAGAGASSPQRQQAQQQPPAAGQPPPPPPPASPPLPARHTAAAPGPRAARLRETYAHALRRTLAKLASWEHFAGCYPTVAARAEGVLRQVQAQMVDKLGDKCEKEFDNILDARGVVPKLNELEALIADAAERRDATSSSSTDAAEPTPPHLLAPSQILAAHLAAHLAPHQSLLNAKLQTTQAQNALLAAAVARQRAELDALLARLDDAVADVRGANDALGAVAADLADEARAAAVDAGT